MTQAYSFLRCPYTNMNLMKEVYYKGLPYEYQTVEINGKRHFQLLKEGKLMHLVDQSELDIKSIVSLILDSYYRNSTPKVHAKAA
jgi:hypothetical protein